MKIIALIMLTVFALDMIAALYFLHTWLAGVLLLLSVVVVRRILLVCRCITILVHRAPLICGCLAVSFQLNHQRTDFLVSFSGNSGSNQRIDFIVRCARCSQSDQHRFYKKPCLDVRVM